MQLVNDLVEIISYYTTPSVTEDLITIDAGIAKRLMYSQVYWLEKCKVARRGTILHGKYNSYHYYRCIVWITRNKGNTIKDHGIATIIRGGNRVVKFPHRNVTNIFYDGLYAYVITSTRIFIYQITYAECTFIKIIDISNAMWACRYANTGLYYILTERMELYTVVDNQLPNKIADNVLRCVFDNSCLHMYIVHRDGNYTRLPDTTKHLRNIDILKYLIENVLLSDPTTLYGVTIDGTIMKFNVSDVSRKHAETYYDQTMLPLGVTEFPHEIKYQRPYVIRVDGRVLPMIVDSNGGEPSNEVDPLDLPRFKQIIATDKFALALI